MTSLHVAVGAPTTCVSLESIARNGRLGQTVLGSLLQQKFSRHGTSFYSHLSLKDSLVHFFPMVDGIEHFFLIMSISYLKNRF